MKKNAFFAMLLALILLATQFSFPVATATTDYDPCEHGDHVYELREVVPGSYGGKRYFTVSSCAYAAYSHSHYYITAESIYIYDCKYCGETKTVSAVHDDTDMGAICTMHDVGR